MKRFYGQNGEDIVLWSLFPDKYKGFYIDVGSLDGKIYNNTLSFDVSGWKGLCIEAHPKYIKLLKKNRPNAIVVHAAVAHKDKAKVIFYSHPRGSFSTLHPELEKEFEHYKMFGKKWKKITVPMRTLNSLLKENDVDKVDVVSIDVEGGEINVLRGFDLKRFKPRILVLEAITKGHENRLRKYMNNSGYYFSRRLSNNLFFCRDKKDVTKIKAAKVSKKRVTKFKHPLDK